MSAPFPEEIKALADASGISLYQRFDVQEASLFLRCPQSDVKQLVSQQHLNCVQITPQQVEFFGYQLVEYLLSQTTHHRTTPAAPDPADRIIRAKQVQEMTGLSRTTIWRLENSCDFPRRVNLGANSVGWHLREVQSWMNDRQH